MCTIKKVDSDGMTDPQYNSKEKKLLSFTANVNNIGNKYEFFNVVVDSGDSITASSKGEEYVSMSLIIDLVKEIVQQELVAAGVLKK